MEEVLIRLVRRTDICKKQILVVQIRRDPHLNGRSELEHGIVKDSSESQKKYKIMIKLVC